MVVSDYEYGGEGDVSHTQLARRICIQLRHCVAPSSPEINLGEHLTHNY